MMTPEESGKIVSKETDMYIFYITCRDGIVVPKFWSLHFLERRNETLSLKRKVGILLPEPSEY